MKIGIYIPSRGRPGGVRTLNSIPNKYLPNTFIVCTHGQLKDYKAVYGKWTGLNIVQAAKSVDGIGKKRDWMIDHATKQGYTHIIMMDDDLIFAKRREDDPTKFLPQTPEDNEDMLECLAAKLREYVHVGIVARDGANRHTESVLKGHRMMRVLAYDLSVLKAYKIKFTRLALMEDFDVTLQLLRRGHLNAVLTDFTNDQGSSNAPGGCSLYRTMEMQAESAHALHALHPEFVKVVTKPDKGGWGGERIDVQIAWKKAFASSAQGVLV